MTSRVRTAGQSQTVALQYPRRIHSRWRWPTAWRRVSVGTVGQGTRIDNRFDAYIRQKAFSHSLGRKRTATIFIVVCCDTSSSQFGSTLPQTGKANPAFDGSQA